MNNDLISREALKEHKFLTPQVKVIGGRRCGKIREQIIEAYQKGWNECIDAIIDNAPTVEPDKVLVANVTFDEDKLKDIVQTEVIEKIKSGELVIKDERPQNEYFDMSKLRLMTVEECAEHTIDYAMGWKACIEWIKKGGAI